MSRKSRPARSLAGVERLDARCPRASPTPGRARSCRSLSSAAARHCSPVAAGASPAAEVDPSRSPGSGHAALPCGRGRRSRTVDRVAARVDEASSGAGAGRARAGRPGPPASRPPPSAPRRRPRPARRTAASLEHRQATVAPLRGERVRGGVRVDRPGSWTGLDAAGLEQVGGERRPARCAPRPGRAWRGTPTAVRRWPPGARRTGRSASNASSRRTRGRPAAGRVRGRARGATGALGEVRELADAGDRFAAAGEAPAARSPRWPRAARRPGRSAAPRSWPPARSISWNHAQAALREVVGQPLDVPGAAGRVDDPRQVGLLQQDRWRCCGRCGGRTRPAGPRACVEGQHGDRVGAADPGGQGRRPWCAACSPTGRGGSSSP